MADRAVATVKQPSSVIDTWQEDPDMTFFRETYYGKNINDTQFRMLVLHAGHLGLDVIKGEMQAISIDNKMIPYVTIHGLRKIAELSGKFNGSDGPEYCGKDRTTWLPFWDADEPPVAARFTVYKKGEAHPITAYVTYKDCVKLFTPQGGREKIPTKTWREMPAYMLGIRAESIAIKKARLVPTDLPSLDGDPRDEHQVRIGSLRHLHHVGEQNGLDHDGVRAVVTELNPGVTSLKDVQAVELIEAAGYIAAGLADPVRADLGRQTAVSATVNVDGIAIDRETGEILRPTIPPRTSQDPNGPSLESQRVAIRKMAISKQIGTNELTALVGGDVDALTYEYAAGWIKFLTSATKDSIRAELASRAPEEAGEDDGADGIADEDLGDVQDTNAHSQRAIDIIEDHIPSQDAARRRAKAESLTR